LRLLLRMETTTQLLADAQSAALLRSIVTLPPGYTYRLLMPPL
jgi:hypothetical protein